MIDFTCSGCGRGYRVADTFAGRSAKCKACGAEVVVPSPTSRPASPTGGGSMRRRRLLADEGAMRTAFAEHAMIRLIAAKGEPPESYELEYRVNGLARDAAGRPAARGEHRVEIQLTADYPRLAPRCRMLSAVFHPNIDGPTICVGDHWTAGERLVDLAIRIGEMLAYQAYNIKSPLDGEAAMWADLNGGKLPTDARPMRGGGG